MNKLAALSLCLLVSIPVFAQTTTTKSLTWAVKKTEWSATDEKNFQEFVRGIGKAKEKNLCGTTEKCIKHKDANPQFYSKNPTNLRVFSDCADLPYILRGYFAWMNNLPFSYPTAVAKADPADTKPDIRYSRGNKVTKIQIVKTGDNVNTVLINVANAISSAMFRVHPDRDIETNAHTDFYSPKLNRTSIKPGTTVYDPNGHVLVVYDVADDGRILMIDAHPDNSLTKKTYGEAYVRDNPRSGAGFKNWRPFKLVNASTDTNGSLTGGRIQATGNDAISDYNKEQYFGHTNNGIAADWKKGEFIHNGETLKYYDYVRKVLAKGNLKYRPVIELTEMLKSLCVDLQDRAAAVDEGIKSGLQNQSHPERLPENIYGTIGDWETYSTPSRDARFKAALKEARTNTQSMYEKHRSGDASIEYTGNDLSRELRNAYTAETTKCSISYTNSNNAKVTLNLDQVFSRIFALSFDPYHCIELRWGATANELASCRDGANKKSWYSAEQKLRNAIDRDYDIRMDKSLSELPNANLGISVAPNVNLKAYLQSI